MADGLEELSIELVGDLLRSWIDMYDKAGKIYDGFDGDTRRWVDEHGHRIHSLIPVVAMMQPDVRLLCRTLVEDALATTQSMSHPARMFDATDVEAKAGGAEMRDDEVMTLRAEVESLKVQVADLRTAVRSMGVVASRLTDEHTVQPD